MSRPDRDDDPGAASELSLADNLVADELMATADRIASQPRMSGSAEELATFDFIAQYLEESGCAVTRECHPGLVGQSRSASITVLGVADDETISANGYALSPSTPSDGLNGELVDVGDASPEGLLARDVGGKVLLSDGMASSTFSYAADRAGAIAHIHVDRYHVRQGCVSPVWGTPTPATAPLLPRGVALAIGPADGATLRRHMARERTWLRVEAETPREWVDLPLLIADVPAPESNDYVLFSAHVDSWYLGAHDNASANAVQLAIARALSPKRQQLRRGVRFAFWSGHSHGRFAGSTWYCDTRWRDLRDHCVAHVYIDSVGARGADDLSHAPTMAETFSCGARAVYSVSGQRLIYNRISRAGDQSFWGVGIPSVFMVLSAQSEGPGPAAEGLGRWWHTVEDTIDKLDPELLLRDARVYAVALQELATCDVLPFQYSAAAAEMRTALEQRAATAPSEARLSAAIEMCQELEVRLAQFEDRVHSGDVDPDTVNALLRRLGHALIPVNYTESGPFDHDLALPAGPLPGLAPPQIPLAGDLEADAIATVRLLRQRNRLMTALLEARSTLDAALATVDAAPTNERAPLA